MTSSSGNPSQQDSDHKYTQLRVRQESRRILSVASEPQPEPELDSYHQFAKIDEGFFAWHFTLRDGRGDEVASVNRAFRGFGREVGTNYILKNCNLPSTRSYLQTQVSRSPIAYMCLPTSAQRTIQYQIHPATARSRTGGAKVAIYNKGSQD